MAKSKKELDNDEELWDDDDDAQGDEDEEDGEDDGYSDDMEDIESRLEKGEDISNSASLSELLKSKGVIYSCPRCRRIFFRNKWIPDKVTDIYAVRTEMAYCDKCQSRDLNHFIGCIELYDKDIGDRKDAILELAKRIESELENRLPFEKIISTTGQNGIFFIFLNSTRLTIEIAREIRKEFHGSMQYEWYERNQFIRAKWFSEVQNREYFKERIRAAKAKRLGLFSFEID